MAPIGSEFSQGAIEEDIDGEPIAEDNDGEPIAEDNDGERMGDEDIDSVLAFLDRKTNQQRQCR